MEVSPKRASGIKYKRMILKERKTELVLMISRNCFPPKLGMEALTLQTERKKKKKSLKKPYTD